MARGHDRKGRRAAFVTAAVLAVGACAPAGATDPSTPTTGEGATSTTSDGAPSTTGAGSATTTDPTSTTGTTSTTETTSTTVDAPTPDPEVLTPVVAEVLSTPYAVLGADGHQHVTYELFVTNPTSSTLTITMVEVLDGSDPGTVLDTVTGDELAAAIRPLAAATSAAVGPAQVTRVFLDPTFATADEIPASLQHRFTFTLDPDQGAALGRPVLTGFTEISAEEAVVVQPPLRGDRWVVGGGCCFPPEAHRSATLPVNGAFHAPERYAIDFVQLDEEGRLYEGTKEELSSWPFFGVEVHSVADGVVVRTQDGLPEEIPGIAPVGATVTSAGGNYVVVDIGGGNFAFYAHLQPGSLRVSVGDTVAAGQVLGLLGNSGNTTAPHLHFHVMDGPLPLASNGRPFRFDHFTSEGTVTNGWEIEDGAEAELTPSLVGEHREAMPLAWQVVDFGS